jgi:demethylmenaquinone methyltransferase/2-methoxy-6-polyprenyl-1,4-benzoquinol methylase
MARAHLDKRPADVAAMFDEIAGRYDFLNDLLSAGQVRLWRHAVARGVAALPGERVLDLAAGTGTSALAFTASGADCVACDFSLGMLRTGARRLRAREGGEQEGKLPGRPGGSGLAQAGLAQAGPAQARLPRPRLPGAGVSGLVRRRAAGAPPRGAVRFVAGDALRLPFRDAAFDAVTISFGLRNVASPQDALAEMFRVTRPGGRLAVCEFSHLPSRPLRVAYERYLCRALPAIARRAGGSPAYEYLAESIMEWPDQQELARQIRAAGWSAVRWRDLTFGIVALHMARRQ